MTVDELIEQLRQYPGHYEVVAEGSEWDLRVTGTLLRPGGGLPEPTGHTSVVPADDYVLLRVYDGPHWRDDPRYG